MFTAWKFWPLIHCLTYSVIPSQHRILWVNCVDLVWNAILASMSRSTEDIETEEAAAALVMELKEEDEIMEPIIVMRQELVSFVESEGEAFANGTAASNSTMSFVSP
jgi:hypothetical protein